MPVYTGSIPEPGKLLKAINGHRSPRQRAQPLTGGWRWALPMGQVSHAKQRKERGKLKRGRQASAAELVDGASAAAPAGRLLSQRRGVGRGDVSSVGGLKSSGQRRASSLELDTRDICTHRYPLHPRGRGDPCEGLEARAAAKLQHPEPQPGESRTKPESPNAPGFTPKLHWDGVQPRKPRLVEQ